MLVRALGIDAIHQRAENWRKNYKNNRPRIIKEFQSSYALSIVRTVFYVKEPYWRRLW
jgi:hypothetical protein